MAAGKRVALREFTPEEHGTWNLLFTKQAEKRNEQIWSPFAKGIELLGFTKERIPDLEEVNRKLHKLTGFRGVAVEGFEEPEDFYALMANREFPIGYFIRDPSDLGYTPAPDVFHDLYGHLPFLTNRAYADFCQDIGARTISYKSNPKVLREWERLFWFTMEFALVKTPAGNRIFGAGIASSINECRYSLSQEPEVRPFDLEAIRAHEFKIDEMQSKIYLLDSPEQLYSSLDRFEAAYK